MCHDRKRLPAIKERIPRNAKDLPLIMPFQKITSYREGWRWWPIKLLATYDPHLACLMAAASIMRSVSGLNFRNGYAPGLRSRSCRRQKLSFHCNSKQTKCFWFSASCRNAGMQVPAMRQGFDRLVIARAMEWPTFFFFFFRALAVRAPA
jgi:hypothetical protein